MARTTTVVLLAEGHEPASANSPDSSCALSPGVLKSALQKNVRRRRAREAAAVARMLARLSWVDCIRRLLVIALGELRARRVMSIERL